jgi:Flp pilus assembly protein TadG
MRVRRFRQRGAAAVEFALVLPVLLLIVLGTVDWGWFFYVSQVVTNAAREGARVGSLTPIGGSDATAELEAEATSKQYLDGAGLTGATIDALTVGNGIQVTVTYPAGSLTGFLPLKSLMPANTKAVAQMRR